MILQKTLTFFWLLVLLFKALKIAFFLFVFSKPTALLPKKSHVSGNGMPPKKYQNINFLNSEIINIVIGLNSSYVIFSYFQFCSLIFSSHM